MLVWLGRLWASPVTLLGALLCIFYGVRFARLRDGSIHVGVKRLLATKGITGQTFGEIIFTKPNGDKNRALWEHELVHRDQCRVAGAFAVPGYAFLWLVTLGIPGARHHKDHPMECQAQKLRRTRDKARKAKKKADALASVDRS